MAPNLKRSPTSSAAKMSEYKVARKQVQYIYEGPPLRRFWNLKKKPLRKICVSGTVGGPLLMHEHKPKIAGVGSAVW